MMPASTAYKVKDKCTGYVGTTAVQVVYLQGNTVKEATRWITKWFLFSVGAKVPSADLERECRSKVWWSGWLPQTEPRQSAVRRERRQRHDEKKCERRRRSWIVKVFAQLSCFMMLIANFPPVGIMTVFFWAAWRQRRCKNLHSAPRWASAD